jgi:beta-lactam-binding protein with PASTA domain
LKRLDDLNFDNVRTERVESEEPKDTVIAQSVPRYTEIDTTEEIVLTISKGPGVKKALVPNVVGLPFKDAVKMLNDYGFTNIAEEFVESNEPENQVLHQSVAQSTEIDVNTKIILRVSVGPGETQPPTEEIDNSVTKTVGISVPEQDETYYVEIWQNGMRVREAIQVAPGTTQLEVKLTGSGLQTYQLYYLDGQQLPEPYGEFEVNFG